MFGEYPCLWCSDVKSEDACRTSYLTDPWQFRSGHIVLQQCRWEGGRCVSMRGGAVPCGNVNVAFAMDVERVRTATAAAHANANVQALPAQATGSVTVQVSGETSVVRPGPAMANAQPLGTAGSSTTRQALGTLGHGLANLSRASMALHGQVRHPPAHTRRPRHSLLDPILHSALHGVQLQRDAAVRLQAKCCAVDNSTAAVPLLPRLVDNSTTSTKMQHLKVKAASQCCDAGVAPLATFIGMTSALVALLFCCLVARRCRRGRAVDIHDAADDEDYDDEFEPVAKPHRRLGYRGARP